MIEAGKYHRLKLLKKLDFGWYLDGNGSEILLPKRFAPDNAKEGDEVDVFVYHDSEDRIIATTQRPLAIVGDIARLKVVHKTAMGAFMEWGIMKDLFVPLSQQTSRMHEGESYLVYLYLDEMTGRVAATEKITRYLSNEELSIKEREEVDLIIWHKTDIGYKVIINRKHIGVLHFSDVFRELEEGELLKGYIKTIRPENKIDVMLGSIGYQRVGSEAERILEMLRENGGYLPYNDKSAPDDIYAYFGVSKKTFKMTIGGLYKDRKIEITQAGIKLAENQ
ncbi:MAG: RNA-binding protein [Sphingobacteriales bacterium]|nr:MAG: RNA-binding protein [Sphingobacteriales bacterium]